MFIDRATIRVCSGAGGDGAVAFRHEKYVPYGGPAGGDGGRGGGVYLIATGDLSTLLDFRYHRDFVAQCGQPGTGRNKTGKGGEDLLVKVPCGTVVYDAETLDLLADLVGPGEVILAAKGGRGGRGNAAFATPRNRAPTRYEPGGPGTALTLRLELKLLADVGLVGLPNAGKSSLIAAVSAARPKIADYPFTTLEPHLGVSTFATGDSLVWADIPGLIAGAHTGSGLGTEFLRHLERTKILVHVVDLSGGHEGRDPLLDWQIIESELVAHSPALAAKPRFAALNKIDLPLAQSRLEGLSSILRGMAIPVFPISCATRTGLDPLINSLRQLVAKTPAPPRFEPTRTEPPRSEQEGSTITIARHDGAFTVAGTAIEQALVDLRPVSVDEMARFERILKRLGVYEALRAHGVADGDTVRIGDVAFTFVE